MYEEQLLKDIFFILYGGATISCMIACCYLLLRRGNAFSHDVMSSLRLRRWTAALFAAMSLSHLWYLPMYFHTSTEAVKLSMLTGGLLDCLTVFPLAIVVMLVMPQDRRRPLWPVILMVAPTVAGMAICVARRDDALIPYLYAYLLLICLGLFIYMVFAMRQYGRWLRENHSDLEHKELWQSFVVLALILPTLLIYAFEIGGMAYEYGMQVIDIILIGYLLWRVETLSDLSVTGHEARDVKDLEDSGLSQTMRDKIGALLKQHCEDKRLYLQNDISITQLAQQIGTNRSYLSKHFASQGITYNAYINGLRIRHFINIYHEAAASNQPITAQELAYRSGFRSYSTFSAAFKQMVGKTVREWMRLPKS